MDGAPLTVKHGYPVRVLLPGCYGQKQPKWITSMEVTTAKTLGYWESRGWSNEATIQVNSQIWGPDGRVQGTTIDIWGIAHASTSGVAGVEVSTDAGLSWKPAELLPGPSTLVWTEWHFQWMPSLQPGTVQSFTLMVRATDGAGTVQRKAISEAGVLDSTFPGGTSDIQQIVVTVEAPS
jgi:DMSO/TMAO reductase YedYZ molybdopterin-dependent catalytic subunit